jgi:hypothetical protein
LVFSDVYINVASFSWFPLWFSLTCTQMLPVSLDCPFGFLWRVFSWIYKKFTELFNISIKFSLWKIFQTEIIQLFISSKSRFLRKMHFLICVVFHIQFRQAKDESKILVKLVPKWYSRSVSNIFPYFEVIENIYKNIYAKDLTTVIIILFI